MYRLISALVAVSALAGVASAQEPGRAPAPGRAQLLFYDVPTVFSATRTERSSVKTPAALEVRKCTSPPRRSYMARTGR